MPHQIRKHRGRRDQKVTTQMVSIRFSWPCQNEWGSCRTSNAGHGSAPRRTDLRVLVVLSFGSITEELGKRQMLRDRVLLHARHTLLHLTGKAQNVTRSGNNVPPGCLLLAHFSAEFSQIKYSVLYTGYQLCVEVSYVCSRRLQFVLLFCQ